MDALQPSYAGLFAPRGTPAAVLDRLETACRQAMETEAFRSFTANWGAVPSFRGRAEMARLLASEYEAAGRTFRELGVRPE